MRMRHIRCIYWRALVTSRKEGSKCVITVTRGSHNDSESIDFENHLSFRKAVKQIFCCSDAITRDITLVEPFRRNLVKQIDDCLCPGVEIAA